MLTRIVVLVLALGVAGLSHAGPIDRVEPPFWWTGFKHTELQIMIHGHGTATFDVSVDHPGVSISRVERTGNDNFLFLYLDIADAEPGAFDIVLENEKIRVAHQYELREKNPDPAHTQGFTSADVIYLITPDRFANGDPSNDTIEGLGDDLDRSDDYGRHGGDLAGMTAALDYIRDMGFTAIWLNPILENAMPESSYHGYATTDYYKVDPRFGSNEDYRDYVAAAKAKGLGIIMDMITNHCGSKHWWMDDLPASDWLNFQDGWQRTTSAKPTLYDPYASDYDRTMYTDGWYVETMPDLNQRNPLMADYLIQNAVWWIEYTGLTGIRLDTWSFSDKHFLAEWSRRIMEEFPNFNITGEETGNSPALLSYWQRGKQNDDGYRSYAPSMLDFPLQSAMNKSLLRDAAWWDSPWSNVYQMLAHDYLYPDPLNLVIFPDNHDQSRIYTRLGEDYDLFRIAIVYYLTMRGIPQIYYGTEILMSHRGTDSHGVIRSEFPGGWPDHDKNAFTGEGLSKQERQAQEFMRTLLNWRKNADVIHSGKLMQYTPIRHVYVYFRYDDDDTVMVILNRDTEPFTLELDRFSERLADKKRANDVITDRRFVLDEPLELAPRSVLLLEVD